MINNCKNTHTKKTLAVSKKSLISLSFQTLYNLTSIYLSSVLSQVPQNQGLCWFHCFVQLFFPYDLTLTSYWFFSFLCVFVDIQIMYVYIVWLCGGHMCVHSQRPEVDVGNHIWCFSTYPQKQCLIKTQKSLRRLVLLASLLWKAPVSVTQIWNYGYAASPTQHLCGVRGLNASPHTVLTWQAL